MRPIDEAEALTLVVACDPIAESVRRVTKALCKRDRIIRDLRKLADALEQLCAAYRTGSRPSDRTLNTISKLKDAGRE